MQLIDWLQLRAELYAVEYRLAVAARASAVVLREAGHLASEARREYLAELNKGVSLF